MVAFGKKPVSAIAAVCGMVGLRSVAGLSLHTASQLGMQSRVPLGRTGDANASWVPRLGLEDSETALLNLDGAYVAHSNLGGLGPDGGEESIIIAGAGEIGNKTLSLKFMVAENYIYDGKPEENKLSNGLASINMINGERTLFDVSLIDGDGNPVTLPLFYMSVLDIDAGSVSGDGSNPTKDAGIEEVAFSGISTYYMYGDAQVKVNSEEANGITFIANLTGNAADNPTSAWNLTRDQKLKTAMAEYRDTSSFQMGLAVKSQAGHNGRNFLLSGISELVSAPFGPCADAAYLEIGDSTVDYNNLAGTEMKKPGQPAAPKQLRFSGAGTIHGTSVDLWVELVSGHYNPADPNMNGLHGSLGQINMGPKNAATFKFMFVDSTAQEPVDLSNFFFAFYDIDQDRQGSETLIMNSGSGTYFLSNTTSLGVKTKADGSVMFHSSLVGSAKNNPWNSESAVEDDTVTFFFQDPISSFEITYVTNSNAGRNFQFGGITESACP